MAVIRSSTVPALGIGSSLHPGLAQGNEKPECSRWSETALAPGAVEAGVRLFHEVSITAGTGCRRKGGTTHTRNNAAQPQ